jgi:hypothetical protein
VTRNTVTGLGRADGPRNVYVGLTGDEVNEISTCIIATDVSTSSATLLPSGNVTSFAQRRLEDTNPERTVVVDMGGVSIRRAH